MNIKQLIKEAHENAVSKGFYECPECGGRGLILPEGNDMCDCAHCNGTGKDPNKNIGELLMLIVSELGEALEAHRNGGFVNWEHYYMFKEINKPQKERFELTIKDTFEDEIADVFIRLFDLCGYLGVSNLNNISELVFKLTDNLPENFFKLTREFIMLYNVELGSDGHKQYSFSSFYTKLMRVTKLYNIDIEKHIKAKMVYNKTRPYKHGKEY